MASSTPIVRTDILSYLQHEQEYALTVGTPAWYAWLTSATTFTFNGPDGTFTARKEQASNKRGGWYWKAYSKRQGKVHHAYLGKSEALSLERLNTIAAEITCAARSTAEPASLAAPLQLEVRGTLPLQPTSLVGREQETQAACTLLYNADIRLLTITGPGGVGKTRLAFAVAQNLVEHFPGGVYCVSLGPLSDAALVVPTIAQALGFVETGTESLLNRVKAYLHDKHILLMLDNFEQVISAAALIAEILASSPHLKLLITSREILHLSGEHELIVPPLALPDLHKLPASAMLTQYPAIALFTQRASAVKADFTITDTNAAIIAEICTRLDGLPLAIELAAARMKHLPAQILLTRMDRRFQLLVSGARDLPRRQQTLRDALAWSYDLLEPNEQTIFRALSTFIRGCTLEAAEEVCFTLYEERFDTLNTITSLIDKSLLQQIEQSNSELRLSMLETIREYGQECLLKTGEASTTRHAHALYYLALAERAEPELRQEQQAYWLDCLEQESDNLRAALRWFTEQEESMVYQEALRLCAALWRFWLIRNRHGEGYQWAEKALQKSEQQDIPTPIRAKAFFATAVLADSQGQYPRSIELWKKCLLLYEELSDQAGIAATLNKLGTAYARNAPMEAHELYEQSLTLARRENNRYEIADALGSLANEAFALGFLQEARNFIEERLTIARTLRDIRSIAYCLDGLGQLLAHMGDYQQACILLKECLSLHREVGDRVGITFALLPLAIVTLYQGDYNTAQSLLEECLMISRELGNQPHIANYLNTLRDTSFLRTQEHISISKLLEESIATFKEAGNDESIATKLFALGCIEFAQGNFISAQKSLTESLSLFQSQENRVMTAAILNMQGHLEAHQGHYAVAHTLMEESLLLTRAIDDHWMLSSRLTQLGLIALNEGNHEQARVLIEESVVLAKQIGDQRYIAEALHIMGLLALYEGDDATAQSLLNECLAMQSEMRNGSTRAYVLADLGLLALHQTNFVRACTLIEESLALCMRSGDRWFVPSCLERLGEVIVMQGQPSRATLLWGAAQAMRETIGAPIPTIERDLYRRSLALARHRLGEARFTHYWQKGYALTLEQALHISEADMHTPDISSKVTTSHQIKHATDAATQKIATITEQTLTNREIEVLQLVAQGLTNVQIAENLVISPRTVQAHLRTIYSKLGIVSRSAATRYAIQHSL